jgi:hypothetical protein
MKIQLKLEERGLQLYHHTCADPEGQILTERFLQTLPGHIYMRPTQGDFHHDNGDSCDSPYIRMISYLPVFSW